MVKSMEDHELIKRAAAAAGIKYDEAASKPKEGRQWWGLWKTFDREPSEYDKRYWNPLRDDGDALRLAVGLGMSVISGTYKVVCEWVPQEDDGNVITHEQYGDDPAAATRRAIVRAAAELPPNAK